MAWHDFAAAGIRFVGPHKRWELVYNRRRLNRVFQRPEYLWA